MQTAEERWNNVVGWTGTRGHPHVDRTQAPSVANEGIAKSLAEQIGAGAATG